MKHISIPLRNFSVLVILISSFIACERDFATIDSDIVTSDATHFDSRNEDFEIITYNDILQPVQANNYPVNLLGVFNDPIYGQSTASFVSQLSSTIGSPDFGENVVLDSVVLTIPYFSTAVGVENEETLYELDSVFGDDPIDVAIYENNFFLRSIDPNGNNLNDAQIYYTDRTVGNSKIPTNLLEGTLIDSLKQFVPENKEIILKDTAGEITNRLAPSLRVKLDLDFWQQKIIDRQGDDVLRNVNNFNNYFRGIYFKAEAINDNGNLSLLNLGNGESNITLYFTRDNTGVGTSRFTSSYTLNFTGNRVNFLTPLEFNIPEPNTEEGDERLYLKGGQGSRAIVQLFGGDDTDSDPSVNDFEAFKNQFVETDDSGNFVKAKRLINEANLVFFVDQETTVSSNEPERLFIYDATNNQPLIDYFSDFESSDPINTRSFHLGNLEHEDDDIDNPGVRYKFRITEHIKNLLLNDSTNVDLGLSVSANVNIENDILQFDVLSAEENDKIPVSSLLTPRSSVLFGGNVNDESKKVYLEIFYSEPDSNN